MKLVHTKNLTFKKVWTLFQENSEQLKETDRIIKENAKEAADRMKETDRVVKETNRQLGKLGNRFGEMVEYMVRPSLLKKFSDTFNIITPEEDYQLREW